MAQEFYFAGNAADENALRNTFVQLANVPLPAISSDKNSQLLPLLYKHTTIAERWRSAATSGARETARLELNETIRTINGLLGTECKLEPILLYQTRPKSGASRWPGGEQVLPPPDVARGGATPPR